MAFSRGFLIEATFARIIEAGLLRWQMHGNIHPADFARSAISGSFASDVGAFPGHRAFHQKHHGYQPQRHHGQHQKDIEVSKCRCLLVARTISE
jgi:hypothetical protein